MSMNIIIKCIECKEELTVLEITNTLSTEIVLAVSRCLCEVGDAADCSKCEDLKLYKQRAELAETKLEYIRNLFDGDKDKPAQPTKVESHATKCDGNESGHNDLEPTEDIVSTGGAIVPGIREGSAQKAKANYSKGLPA